MCISGTPAGSASSGSPAWMTSRTCSRSSTRPRPATSPTSPTPMVRSGSGSKSPAMYLCPDRGLRQRHVHRQRRPPSATAGSGCPLTRSLRRHGGWQERTGTACPGKRPPRHGSTHVHPLLLATAGTARRSCSGCRAVLSITLSIKTSRRRTKLRKVARGSSPCTDGLPSSRLSGFRYSGRTSMRTFPTAPCSTAAWASAACSSV
jgi:hypothetical protein